MRRVLRAGPVSVELHLPDLPEVPISLGPAEASVRRTAQAPAPAVAPAPARELFLLPAFAGDGPAGAGQLVAGEKLAARRQRLPRSGPSVPSPTTRWSSLRWSASTAKGRLKLRIEGARLKHFPATDRIEIEDAQIRAIAEDGRVTLARARQALGNGDGSEVQLRGGAEVTSTDASGAPLVMRSEFLHAFLVTEQVRSHLPVQVQMGSSQLRAAGLDYDHGARRLDLLGPMRAELTPRAARGCARCPNARRHEPEMNAPLVFITGASSGIGLALAARYAAAGWRLALVARRTAEMQAWAAALGLGPERAAVYGADVAVADSIVAAGAACIAAQGLPDVVVACAGISVGMDTAERADLAVMHEVFALNNIGLAATFHPFLAAMRARGSGTLVGVASVAAIRGLPGHGAYSASKAAVVAYCESLRVECRGSGVRVVTLLPGLCGHAADGEEPLQHAFPDGLRSVCRTRLPRHPGRPQLQRHSLADGCGGEIPAAVAQRAVRPPDGRPWPQAAPQLKPRGHEKGHPKVPWSFRRLRPKTQAVSSEAVDQ